MIEEVEHDYTYCCPHDMWDHEFIDESYDSLFFGGCEMEGCECERYEEPY